MYAIAKRHSVLGFSNSLRALANQGGIRFPLPKTTTTPHFFSLFRTQCGCPVALRCHPSSSADPKLISSPISRSYNDKAVDENPGPHDQKILDLLNTGRLDYKALDQEFAHAFRDSSAQLQLKTFFSLVKRFQHIKHPQAAEALPAFVLGWMIKFYQHGRLAYPEKKLFGMAMQCYAKSNHPKAGELAEQFLNEIERIVEQDILGLEILHAHVYSAAMKPYARVGNSQKAKALFDRCQKDYEEGNDHAKPNIIAWGTLIDAYAKSGRADAGDLALKRLRAAEKSGLKANTICYNSVIDAFAKSSQPEKAEEVLDDMYKAYKAGNPDCQPDVSCFNAVINSWALSRTVEGAQRSEKILQHMIKLYEDATLPVRPNTISYSTVISAYGRVGLPREAQKVLAQMYTDFLDGNQEAELEERSFLGVVEGWFNSGEAIAGEQAERILDRMEELYKQGVLKERPQVQTYNAVMKAWREVKQPKKAAHVFHRMLDDFEKRNWSAKPDPASYCTLMDAYANAKLPDAGEKADVALEHMQQMNVVPNLPVYMAAFQCWFCSKGHDPRADLRCRELDAEIRRLKRPKKR